MIEDNTIQPKSQIIIRDKICQKSESVTYNAVQVHRHTCILFYLPWDTFEARDPPCRDWCCRTAFQACPKSGYSLANSSKLGWTKSENDDRVCRRLREEDAIIVGWVWSECLFRFIFSSTTILYLYCTYCHRMWRKTPKKRGGLLDTNISTGAVVDCLIILFLNFRATRSPSGSWIDNAWYHSTVVWYTVFIRPSSAFDEGDRRFKFQIRCATDYVKQQDVCFILLFTVCHCFLSLSLWLDYFCSM